VLWDFDGTLASRHGLWSGCVLEVLDELEPGHAATLERVRAGMRGAFPWNRHEQPHTHLADADEWWSVMEAAIAEAVCDCGVAARRGRELAAAVRARFIDGTRAWQLFEDSRAALTATAQAGWRNVILSNHVPELHALVETLGLSDLVERTFSSGETGYEKPHPEAYLGALRACGAPAERWMIGDNPLADVRGAEALGIPAILVRSDAPAPTKAPDAAGAAALVCSTGR